MSLDIKPEELLVEIGGCGLHQILLCTIIQTMKIVVCWDMEIIIFSAKTPEWWCVDDLQGSNHTVQQFEKINNVSLRQTCTTINGSRCSKFLYEEGMKTLVNEWDLVCDRSWIPATFMSSQMAGLLFGHVLVGYLADIIGRKKPLLASLLLLLVCNLATAFSVSWIMFLVLRIFTGLAMGGFLTLLYSLMGEFTLAKWRPLIVAVPSWTLESLLFTLTAWRVPNWRYLHYIISAMAAAFLPTFFFIPESFRWLLAHGKTSSAYNVMQRVATLNGQSVPETVMLQLKTPTTEEHGRDKRTYSFVDVIKSKHLRKITGLLMFCWFGLGFVSYGVRFGVNAWSGSIFFNMFLMAVTQLPAIFLSIYMMNRFGRKNTSLISFGMVCIAAAIVGIINYIHIDTVLKDNLKKAFALVASLGIGVSWGMIQTMSTELYPTVVRSNGYGFLNIIARVGAIVGPQLVYFETHVPGILYFLSFGIALLGFIALLLLPETKDKPLQDRIED